MMDRYGDFKSYGTRNFILVNNQDPINQKQEQAEDA
jgi:hypothetical protein